MNILQLFCIGRMNTNWSLLLILVSCRIGKCYSSESLNVLSSSKEGVCIHVCGKTLDDVLSTTRKIDNQAVQLPAQCDVGKPKDCDEIPRSCPSGPYRIYPKHSKGFEVFCEMSKYGGGWTVFQRRVNGAIDFFRGWNDYKTGFGDIKDEFWLGNDNIHSIVYQGRYQLLVELTDYDNKKALARYRQFMIGSEATKYKLSVGVYSGNAGDSLSYHNGMAFTTKDRDNDRWGNNCATENQGAWWFNVCKKSHLNGEYFYTKNQRGSSSGIYWSSWKGTDYSLKASEMMMRMI